MNGSFKDYGLKPSGFFAGAHKIYGRYQWNIKHYDWRTPDEIRAARHWAFGRYNLAGQCFERINYLLGRVVRAGLAGKNGGWFVIHEELTPDELEKVNEYIAWLKWRLPSFLADERQYTRMARKPAPTLESLLEPRPEDRRKRRQGA